MSRLSRILRKLTGGKVAWWCPGCDDAHAIVIEGPGAWGWDGNAEAPTFSPSIKVEGFELTLAGRALLEKDQFDGTIRGDGFTYPRIATICHSFVKAGRMEFLGDCTHPLAGQTVSIAPWPEAFDDGDRP